MLTLYLSLFLFVYYFNFKKQLTPETFKIFTYLFVGCVALDVIVYFGIPTSLNFYSATQTTNTYDASGKLTEVNEVRYIPSTNTTAPTNSFMNKTFFNVSFLEILEYLHNFYYFYLFVFVFNLPWAFIIFLLLNVITLVNYAISFYRKRVGIQD